MRQRDCHVLWVCVVLFVLGGHQAPARAQTCGIGGLDFSVLTKSAGAYVAPEAGTTYSYVFNVCANANSPSFSDCHDLMCQYDGNTYITYVAQNSGATWVLDSSGATVTYSNGDSTGCDSIRVGKIKFTCDPDHLVGTIAAEELPPTGSCQYQVNFATSAACKTVPCSSCTSQSQCDQTSQGGSSCVWCNSTIVPSQCYTAQNASHLPPNQFQCDSKPGCPSFTDKTACQAHTDSKGNACDWCQQGNALNGKQRQLAMSAFRGLGVSASPATGFCVNQTVARDLPPSIFTCSS